METGGRHLSIGMDMALGGKCLMSPDCYTHEVMMKFFGHGNDVLDFNKLLLLLMMEGIAKALEGF